MTYRFLTPALAEIRDAAVYYEERVPGLGADFLDEVDATMERILGFPEAWGSLGGRYRRCHLRRLPHFNRLLMGIGGHVPPLHGVKTSGGGA